MVLRTEDSSCWYRKPRLRPILGVGFDLNWVEDMDARLECAGSRRGEYAMARGPSGMVIRRQNRDTPDQDRLMTFPSTIVIVSHFGQLSYLPSTLIAAFLNIVFQ